MSKAFKCDGCGSLFEKRFDSFNKYVDLPHKEKECIRLYLTLNSEGDIELCNKCLFEIISDYSELILSDLRSHEEVKDDQ